MRARKTNHCSYDFSLFFVDPLCPMCQPKRTLQLCWHVLTKSNPHEDRSVRGHRFRSRCKAFFRNRSCCDEHVTSLPKASTDVHKNAKHFQATNSQADCESLCRCCGLSLKRLSNFNGTALSLSDLLLPIKSRMFAKFAFYLKPHWLDTLEQTQTGRMLKHCLIRKNTFFKQSTLF